MALTPSEIAVRGEGEMAQFGEESSTALPRRRSWIARVVFYGGCAVLIAAIFSGMLSRELVGVAAIALMLLLLFMKVPLFVAMAVPGLLAYVSVAGFRALEFSLMQEPFASVQTWELSVLPMFVFMGLLLWQSGVTERLYSTARMWLGWLPGGLAIGTNFAGTGLAAVSGTSLGTVYALGRIGIPEMLKAGYNKRLAVGSVLVASLPGPLIPPSIILIIYAGIAEIPVGPLLLGGLVPGLLIAALVAITILLICLIRPSLAGSSSVRYSWRERFRGLVGIWPVPILIIAVLGGLFSGVLTATEAGAAGALGALIILLTLQRKSGLLKKAFSTSISGTIATVGSIFLVIMGAHILSGMLSVTGLGAAFTGWITSLGLSRIQFLLILFIGYVIIGMVIEPLSMLLLTTPLLLPVLNEMDISLLWFGVFAAFMAEMAILTPPVGLLSFIVHGIAKRPEVNQGQQISLKDIFSSIGWFMPTIVIFVLLLILFPEIVTFIPSISG